MSKPLRYTGDWPPPNILHEYPNWICAWDEEGEEDQDETTLKPEDRQDIITEDTIHTAGDVLFASGQKFPAIISMPSGRADDFSYHNGKDWIRCLFDGRIHRWIPFDQDWLPPERRAPTVDFLNLSLFPIRLSSRLSCAKTGKPFQVTIHADGTETDWQ